MPLPFVVDIVSKLHFENDTINTWKKGVVRALQKFIRTGTKAVGQTCPNCGEKETLVYQEGCPVCKSCGYTKCG